MLCISIDGDDATWTGHLEFKVGVVQYCVEASEGRSSEQYMITTSDGGDGEE